MPVTHVGDINLYYVVHGKGDPLVMVLGGGASVDWIYREIPVFSREYRLLVYDNRGSGRSDKPDIPYSTRMMADDLAGLLDALKIESAHIQGTSLGGMIAQQFALNYPARVRSLILASTYCGGKESVINPDSMIKWGLIQNLPLKEVMMETLRMCITRRFIDDNPELIQEFLEKMIRHPMPPVGQKRQGEAVAGHATYERLPEIKIPTLVIHGGADEACPVENAKILASRIPGAELAIIKNTGHGFFYESFDEKNRIILDFLKKHSSSVK